MALHSPAAELLDQTGDAAGDQVVAEVHDEPNTAEEGRRHLHRVRQTERRLLRDVGDAGAGAEPRAVAERAP